MGTIHPYVFLAILSFLFKPGMGGFLDNLFRPPTSINKGSFYEHENDEKQQFSGSIGCDESPLTVLPRIIGGSPVTDQQTVPYMAAIGEKLNNGTIAWFCGGSLVSEKIVLTAAHCLSRNVDVVRLGGTDLHPRAQAQDVAVASSEIHPEYRKPRSYHDLAILRLATSVRQSRGVRPICLATNEAGRTAGEISSVAGWGVGTNGGDGTQELHKVKVNIFSNPECDRVYSQSPIGKVNFPNGITEGQLCAGVPEGGKDSCQGDSGGPLVVEDDQGKIRLLGIVSSGAGCGLKEFPGVYIRVSAYDTWIKKFLR